ncbi:MAG: hypothetical protein KDA61_05190, partial [Planctomycetales bacterium]|nr:hypothetical protein [Planctomycetales bacterium]
SGMLIYPSGELEANSLLIADGLVTMLSSGSNARVDVATLGIGNTGVLTARDAGTKYVDVSSAIANDGAIRSTNGALLRITPGQTATLDLDGASEQGAIEADGGNIWIMGGTIADAFSGRLLISSGRHVDVLPTWTIDGDVELEGVQAPAELRSSVHSRVVFKDATVTATGNVRVTAPSRFTQNADVSVTAGSVLTLGGTNANVESTWSNFTGPGSVVLAGDLSINNFGSTSFLIDSLDLDGPQEDVVTTIANGSILSISSTTNLEKHDSRIQLDGGRLVVDGTNSWIENGVLALNDGGRVDGSRTLIMQGALRVTGAGNSIDSPTMLGSSTTVDLGSGSTNTVNLRGSTDYSGGTYEGAGTLRQSGPAVVSGSTTIGAITSYRVIAPNVYQPRHVRVFDWDGLSETDASMRIEPGKTLVINADQIDTEAPSVDGYDGVLTIDRGTLIVNTGARTPIPIPGGGTPGQITGASASPTSWRLDGTIDLQGTSGQVATVATQLGSPVVIYGSLNATSGPALVQTHATLTGPLGSVRVKSGATLTMTSLNASAGDVFVDAGGQLTASTFRLASGARLEVDGAAQIAKATFSGGETGGAGEITLTGMVDVVATSTLGGNVRIATGSELDVSGGGTLFAAGRVTIDSGVPVSGGGGLSIGVDGELVLSDGLSIELPVANTGLLRLGEASSTVDV